MSDWYSRPNVMADEEGHIRFRSSALGGCETSLAWDLRESKGFDSDLPGQTPFPQNVQIAMDESSALESHVFDLLADGNWPLIECQEPVSREFGNLVLEGTVDGMAEHGEYFVEIKTVGESLFNEILSSSDKPWQECSPLVQKYRWQVGCYHLLYGKPIHLAVALKKNGKLDGSFHVMEWGDFSVPSKQEIVDKMSTIVELALEGDEPLRCTGGELCKWQDRHSRPEIEVGKQLTLLRIQEEMAKSVNEEVRQLREEIAELVQSVGGKAECQGVKLTWVQTHVVEKKPREYDRNYLKITWPETNG